MTLPIFMTIIIGFALICFAGIIYLCVSAPQWDQEEEGSFYVEKLGGDHE